MAVPTRRDAAQLLLDLAPPGWFLAHVSAVAEVAAFLAQRVAHRGIRVDRGVVEAAALLHDVDKLFPDDHPLSDLAHGEAGARWLTEQGHAELARSVAAHPVRCLADEEAYRRWAAFARREERIVAYADKRAGQRLESMASRFADWERRYPEYRDGLERARARAERLEQEVCRAAGLSPDEVARLPWVRRALAAARQQARSRRPAAPPRARSRQSTAQRDRRQAAAELGP